MNMPALHSQPAWFGAVMGTGATSSLLYVTSDRKAARKPTIFVRVNHHPPLQ